MKPYSYSKVYDLLRMNGHKGSADQLYQWMVACRVMADYSASVSRYHALRYTGDAISYDSQSESIRIVIMVGSDEYIVRRVQRDYPHMGIRALCSDLSYAVGRNIDVMRKGYGWDSNDYQTFNTYNDLRQPISGWVK